MQKEFGEGEARRQEMDEKTMMTQEETVAALWEIAHKVATEDTVSEHAFGGYDYCIFCSGHEYRMLPFKHEPHCIVLKARALMAQDAQQH